jgi:uncharacterized NAD(P)/FAD-binding protein YdhS
MTERPTVAVIGAGFSGLLTALRLLALDADVNVRLIERRGAFARGAAYSTLDPEHLLNVRASNMSAFPEDPEHFVKWLSSCGHERAQSQFVRRHQYGDYLQAMIQDAVGASPAGRFILEADAATAVERIGERWRVTLGMGRSIDADAVVLAIGNLPPTTLSGFAPEATASPAYVADPWSLDAEHTPKTGEALLIGTGLSMVDVALHLARRQPGLRMLALSRRGLLPRRHLSEGPVPLVRPAPSAPTPLGLLRDLRHDARIHDWRAALDGLRPHVHGVWRGWSAKDRQRFLRHARPWWDVHRHRLAPPVAAKLDHIMGTGGLRVEAGRLKTLSKAGDELEATWTPRGSTIPRRIRAALVVNCAGPNGDPARSTDPLIANLLRAGLVRSDACRLGLDTDENSRLIAADGAVNQKLFAVGPIMRGALWEITSVPDIRVQAAKCAQEVYSCLIGIRGG